MHTSRQDVWVSTKWRCVLGKYKQVKVNFSIEDHAKLTNLAKAQNKTIAELIRSHLDTKIENAPQRNKTVIYKNADPRLLYELNKIGNNINQIARHLNVGHMLEKRVLIKIYEKVMQL